MENLECIYNKYFRFVCNIARKYVDETCVRDIAQQVFLKLSPIINNFSNHTPLRRWLYVTTTNLAIDQSRAPARRSYIEKKYFDEKLSISTADEDHEKELEQIKNEVLGFIFSEIEKLPPRTKQVFSLYYFKRLTAKQISIELNIAPATVLNQLQTARDKLRMKILFKK